MYFCCYCSRTAIWLVDTLQVAVNGCTQEIFSIAIYTRNWNNRSNRLSSVIIYGLRLNFTSVTKFVTAHVAESSSWTKWTSVCHCNSCITLDIIKAYQICVVSCTKKSFSHTINFVSFDRWAVKHLISHDSLNCGTFKKISQMTYQQWKNKNFLYFRRHIVSKLTLTNIVRYLMLIFFVLSS